MNGQHAGSLSRAIAWQLAMLALAGLSLACLGVYAATALSFSNRQMETLRQKELQVRYLAAEASSLGSTALAHKLDDALVGRQDVAMTLRGTDDRVLYAGGRAPVGGRTRSSHFEVQTPVGSMQAALVLDKSEDDRVLSRLALTLAAAAAIGTLVITAGGMVLVRAGLRPVRDLAAQVRALAADTLDRRLDGSAQPQELSELVEQINELLQRLHRAYEQVESFNADVAHELFTPLTTLIGGTEVALRKERDAPELLEVLGQQLEELRRMAFIVQDMLFLSRADRGAQARRETTESLAKLATSVIDLYAAALEDATLSCRVEGDADLAVDARLVQRALSNLLGNATQHARRGTEVVVKIEKDGTLVWLLVVNQGATIPSEHLARVFDRFYRVDASRSGAGRNHGLGLAIVAAIARMHGGQTTAKSADGTTLIGLCINTPVRQ